MPCDCVLFGRFADAGGIIDVDPATSTNPSTNRLLGVRLPEKSPSDAPDLHLLVRESGRINRSFNWH